MNKSRNQLIEAIDKMIAVSSQKNLNLSGCAYLEFRNPIVTGDDFENINLITLSVPLEEMTCGFRGCEVIVTTEDFLDGANKPIRRSKEVFSFKDI